jgi:hypothetical protein
LSAPGARELERSAHETLVVGPRRLRDVQHVRIAQPRYTSLH